MRNKSIPELAQDFAEGTELVLAIQQKSQLAVLPDPARRQWAERWLELSDWARQRELRAFKRAMEQGLVELRESCKEAEAKADEAFQASADYEGLFSYVTFCNDPHGKSEVTERWRDTKNLRRDALLAMHQAAMERALLEEAEHAIALAELRTQILTRHTAELRQVRKRAVAWTFLLTIVLIFAAAILMHFALAVP